MELQLTHFRLIVSNYKDTFLFYRNLLGFAPDWGDENTGYAEIQYWHDPTSNPEKRISGWSDPYY